MVATVVNITSASSTVHYFRREGYGSAPRGTDGPGADYYALKEAEQRKASRWHGRGASALGLGGPVEPEAFRRILEGHVPGTDVRLGRTVDGEHVHRPGIDITLSAPKSVSLEALLPGPGTMRDRARRAHDAAVRSTLDFIESRLLRTRRWDPETKRSVQVNAPRLVAATFRHVTSRNNDPQLHTHCVVANMTREGARWRSAEIGLLRRSQRLIGAYYRNVLAGRLRQAGLALRPSMVGRVPGFEISGWSGEALEAFSTRRRDILEFIREHGWAYNAKTAQAATLVTRRRKNEPRLEELEALWSDYMRANGIAREKHRVVGRRKPEPLPALEICWRAVGQLEERASVFPMRDALGLALAHSPGVYSLEEIEAGFGQLERDGHLIRAIRRGVGEAWTTARSVNAEREVIALMKSAQGSVRPLVGHSLSDEALKELTGSQKEAARLILESRDRTVGVQGYAGSGKTTMLRRVAELAQPAGTRKTKKMIGLAPSSSAARNLSRETGMPCRTLQWYLARYREVADGTMDDTELEKLRDTHRGSLLVVDEMSLAGTAQTRALLRIAERLDIGRLVLVGDSRQLQGVEAGQPFRQLQRAGMATALMDELRRQRNPDLRAAVRDLIEGDPAAAMGRLGDNLHEAPYEELGRRAAELWLRLSPEAREGTALFAPTHELREEMNHAVREGLEMEGALGGNSMRIDTLVSLGLTRQQTGDARFWREGDVALFHNDLYHYRIRRNDACTVTGVDMDRVMLDHPDGGERHLDPGGQVHYRLDLYRSRTLEVREGERIRWTRNDNRRGLVNGEEARVLAIGGETLKLRVADGREMDFSRDDPQLRHVDYAYAATVHGVQGQSHERVIAVLDSSRGPLSNQKTVYVQLSRARENAVMLTDNREQLVETLEASTGERMTALEAVGEHEMDVGQDRKQDPKEIIQVPDRPPVHPEEAARHLDDLQSRREDRKNREVLRDRARRAAAWHGEAREFLAAAPEPFFESTGTDGEPVSAVESMEDMETVQAYAREERYLGLESLVNRGRTEIAEAVRAGAVDAADVEQYRETQRDLQRMLARETRAVAERRAADRARDWIGTWEAAAEPGDPYGARSPVATVERGRDIAADPVLGEELRTEVNRILEANETRDTVVADASLWLEDWRRYEGPVPGQDAALEEPDARETRETQEEQNKKDRIGEGRGCSNGPDCPSGWRRTSGPWSRTTTAGWPNGRDGPRRPRGTRRRNGKPCNPPNTSPGS